MSLKKFESTVVHTVSCVEDVFATLTNLEFVKHLENIIPAEHIEAYRSKIQSAEIEHDCIRVKIDGLGPRVCMRIVDSVPNDYVKYDFENLPMEMHFWVQMKTLPDTSSTALKLTLHIDVPMMLAVLLPDKKLREGLEMASKVLASLPFGLLKSV